MITRTRGQRIPVDERPAVVTEVARRYYDGASIRGLSAELGMSYGLIHRLLREAGVTFRPRGGYIHPTA